MNLRSFYLLLFLKNSLSLGLNPNMYNIYKHNGMTNLKFTSTFENTNLLESFTTSSRKFTLIKCISSGFKNSLARVVSYQINEGSTIECKSYSSLYFQSNDILMSATKSTICLRSNTCKQIFFLILYKKFEFYKTSLS